MRNREQEGKARGGAGRGRLCVHHTPESKREGKKYPKNTSAFGFQRACIPGTQRPDRGLPEAQGGSLRNSYPSGFIVLFRLSGDKKTNLRSLLSSIIEPGPEG